MIFNAPISTIIKKDKKKDSFKKSFFTGCMVLSLSASCIFAETAFAGPADDITLKESQQAGPGGSSPAQEAGNPQSPAEPQFFDAALPNPVVHPVDLYSYEQMEQDIHSLAALYGGHMTVSTLAQTWDGRNIYDIIVGNPNASKQILIQGNMHAREYITVPLVMQQMEYLLANYDTAVYKGMPLADFLNQTAVHFVPMANPDGTVISQFGESAIRSEALRQGIQACYAADVAEGRTSQDYATYLKRWKSNGRGVDLNHNFDAEWYTIDPGLNHFSSSSYKGETPLSEPESQAIANLTNQYPFAAVINYHAMGNVIYWDTANNQKSGDSLAMAQLVSSQNGYSVLGTLGVGGLKDWLQVRQNPIAGITIELGRSTAPVSFSEYPAIWNQNKAVPISIVEYVLTH